MSRADLIKELERVEEIRRKIGDDPGNGQIFIKVVRRRGAGERVRVAPGLMGRLVGEWNRLPGGKCTAMVEVRARDMRRFLERQPP